MDTFTAVRTMLAVREYQERSIPDEIVTRILEAARLTGSSRNSQQWDFVVVRKRETLEKLGQLATTGPFIAGAPLAIAVVVPSAPVGHVDGARATQDMMLTAWEAGIGSNWVGNVDTEEVKTLLDVPQERMVLTIIPFGYPVNAIGKGKKKRKALANVAHDERFGRSYSPT